MHSGSKFFHAQEVGAELCTQWAFAFAENADDILLPTRGVGVQDRTDEFFFTLEVVVERALQNGCALRDIGKAGRIDAFAPEERQAVFDNFFPSRFGDHGAIYE